MHCKIFEISRLRCALKLENVDIVFFSQSLSITYNLVWLTNL